MGRRTNDLHEEGFMQKTWRPAMGWMYMGVCVFDFVIAPILWSATQAYFHGNVTDQWDPLTLQGAGLFHLSMGAILGISAYGRTQEKINFASPVAPTQTKVVTNSQEINNMTGAPVVTGYAGKAAPILSQQPEK